MIDEKLQTILEASHRLFMQHGFKKVTIGDIAAEVGVSRPTLYQAFANKEAIFLALIDRFCAQALEAVEQAIHVEAPLQERLMAAFSIWTIEPYKLLSQSPQAAEIIDCQLEFTKQRMDDCYAAFESILLRLLNESGAYNGKASSYAHLLTSCARGMKPHVKDCDELERLLRELVELICRKL